MKAGVSPPPFTPPPAESAEAKNASHRAAIGETMGRAIIAPLLSDGDLPERAVGEGHHTRWWTSNAWTASRSESARASRRFTSLLVWAVVVVCVLPALLTLAGFDFGTKPESFPPLSSAGVTQIETDRLVDTLHIALAGSFVHTLLEWSAVCTAAFIVLLAFVHYRVTGDMISPLIATALFWAGCIDAVHILAADRFVDLSPNSRELIPFTWVTSRFVHSLVLTVGGTILLLNMPGKGSKEGARPFGSVLLITLTGVVFAFAAYAAIHYCATSANLPRTIYANSLVTRPLDIGPLIIYMIGGSIVLPALYSRFPSLFSFALIVSIIPHIAIQAYMAFGSTTLYDSHHNIAHLLKILAYFVPFLGLVMDYIRVHNKGKTISTRLESEISDRMLAEEKLIRNVGELARSNRELDDFAYIASHDLKEPLRGISNYSQFLLEDYGSKLDEEGRHMLKTLPELTGRLEKLINELLNYSRVGRVELAWEETELEDVLEDILVSLRIRLEEMGVAIRRGAPLPRFRCDRVRIGEVFRNLITNAMKYNDKAEKWIEIGLADYAEGGKEITLYVRDNGIGIPEKHQDKVFAIFKRLHGRNEYGGGTGAGMSIVKKIVERHHGRIWIDSKVGEGTTFFITIRSGGEI